MELGVLMPLRIACSRASVAAFSAETISGTDAVFEGLSGTQSQHRSISLSQHCSLTTYTRVSINEVSKRFIRIPQVSPKLPSSSLLLPFQVQILVHQELLDEVEGEDERPKASAIAMNSLHKHHTISSKILTYEALYLSTDRAV